MGGILTRDSRCEMEKYSLLLHRGGVGEGSHAWTIAWNFRGIQNCMLKQMSHMKIFLLFSVIYFNITIEGIPYFCLSKTVGVINLISIHDKLQGKHTIPLHWKGFDSLPPPLGILHFIGLGSVCSAVICFSYASSTTNSACAVRDYDIVTEH